MLRYYHSSQNNARFFDVPHLIRTEEDLERFLEELSRHDILEYIRQQRPDTKWVVHLLTNVTFYLNKLIQHPIGARIVVPDFFLRNQGLACLVGGAQGPYEDNLCFFQCLAVHRGAPDGKALEVPTKTYRRCHLQVSWWRVPYSTDRIRPVRRRRHRSPNTNYVQDNMFWDSCRKDW